MISRIAADGNGIESGASRESELACVLEACLAAIETGQAIEPAALAAAHPAIAERLLACLSVFRLAGQVEQQPDSVTSADAQFGSAAESCLGDFHIQRVIGRGGMGVVFEAEQVSLKRRVALKVLPFAAALDPQQLRRFQIEAQAAAQLHHTNIVPIFSVGCERGVHYYAMQYIEGQSLAALIGEIRRLEADHHALIDADPSGPESAAPAAQETLAVGILQGLLAAQPADSTPAASSTRSRAFFRTVAHLGQQAAEALDHAHRQGIIHRDIKPANLLLDLHGNAWITDFGLARMQADSTLTMTGDVLGTLRYTSPEQASPQRTVVDHRTDVYSLGATLYELLTLHPVHDGHERAELLHSLAFVEPKPPRHWNRAIPRDLETIVLKALSRDVHHRYATALEFANDLRRFLDGKPILARRPSVMDRLGKWSRQHRMVVATAVLFLVLAVVTLATSTVLIARQQREVERQRDEARQAVDDMYTDVATEWLAQQEELEPLAQKFLTKALDYYKRFARGPTPDLVALLKTAIAHRRIGEIQERLGHSNEAESAHTRAVSILQKLVSDAPSGFRYQVELAASRNALARALLTLGRFDEGERLVRGTITLLEKLASNARSEPQYGRELAVSYCLEYLYFRRWETHLPECERAIRRSIALYQELVDHSPSVPEYWKGLAITHGNLGELLHDVGQWAEAELMSRRAVEIAEKLAAVSPSAPNYRSLLAWSLDNLATSLRRKEHSRELEQLYRRVIDLDEKSAADSPSVPGYRTHLAKIYGNMGAHLVEDGRWAEAEPLLRRAVALSERLTAESHLGLECHTLLLNNRHALGILLERIGQLREAEQMYRQAISLAEQLPVGTGAAPEHHRQLATTKRALADLLRATGRAREADEWYCQTIEILKELPDYQSRCDLAWILVTIPEPRRWDAALALQLAKQVSQTLPLHATSFRILGVAHYRTGDWNSAIEALARSMQLSGGGDASDWLFLAMAHWRNGETVRARQCYDRAVDTMDNYNPWDRGLRHFRAEADALLSLTDKSRSVAKKAVNGERGSKP
jgi:serine/threonine protein kinase/tetratricopeptide (TPR) repeat protein